MQAEGGAEAGVPAVGREGGEDGREGWEKVASSVQGRLFWGLRLVGPGDLEKR